MNFEAAVFNALELLFKLVGNLLAYSFIILPFEKEFEEFDLPFFMEGCFQECMINFDYLRAEHGGVCIASLIMSAD